MPALPDTFAALGNATRFAIVERLLKEGELPAGDILDIGNMSPPPFPDTSKCCGKPG